MAQPRRTASPPAPPTVRTTGKTEATPSNRRSTAKQESPPEGTKHFSADAQYASVSPSHGWTAAKAWEAAVRAPAGRLLESTSGAIPLEACTVAVVLIYALLLGLGYRAVLRGLQTLPGRRTRSSSRCVVLLGPSGGGKTSLFLLLRNGKVTPTLPSMQENVETLCIDEGGIEGQTKDEVENEGPPGAKRGAAKEKKKSFSCEVVDFPGHAKLQALAAPYIDRATAIVFLVDASDKKSFKTAAEQLYDLFTKPELHLQQVPLLLVVNKADLPDARSEATVTEDLEREIERSRASRAALLEGEDDAANFIGVEGEVFKLLDHSPFPLEICSASVKNGDIEAIRNFLLQAFTDKAN